MTRISDEKLFVRTFRTDARLLMRIVLKLQQNWIMPFQSLLTIGTIRYAYTRITDI